METSVSDCKLISIPKSTSRYGNIAIVDSDRLLPFSIKRIYYLYDIPTGKERGGHGHRELKQLLIATSGSFVVELYDGQDRKNVFLNRPDIGLLVVPGIWRQLSDFASGSVCLVLASDIYSDADYFYDMNLFVDFKKNTIV
jgi:hypothetical protein